MASVQSVSMDDTTLIVGACPKKSLTSLRPRCSRGTQKRTKSTSPLDDLDGDMVDRLYHETMEDYYSTGTNVDAAEQQDETASTSSVHEPDFVVLNSAQTTDDPLPNPVSSNVLNLQPIQTIHLLR